MNDFETSYRELCNAVATSTFDIVEEKADNCIRNFSLNKPAEFIEQIHAVLSVLWTNPEFVNALLLSDILAPSTKVFHKQNLPSSLVNHPDVIRSLLGIACMFDHRDIYAQPDIQATSRGYLHRLPSVAKPLPATGEIFDHVGSGLLGDSWATLRALYDFPVESNWRMRSVLFQLPREILKLSSMSSQAETPTLPKELIV